MKNILIIVVYILIGLGILMFFDEVILPAWLHVSIAIFATFVVLNIVSDTLFKQSAIATYWSLKRVHYIIPAIVAGCIISVLPTIVALVIGVAKQTEVSFDIHTSAKAIIITVFIVGWEELWFRGVFLNYAGRHLPVIVLSVIIGLLFCLLHAMNPEIDLLLKGPALFGAGALLTLLYFYYRSIWVPIGIHFGNNYIGSIINTPTHNDIFLGGDGYFSALILLSVFLVYAWKSKNMSIHYKSMP